MRERRNSKRRLISGVIALALALACSVNSPAAMDFTKDSEGNYVTTEDENGFYYLATEKQYASGQCKVYVYGGNKKDIVLPKTCGSYRVTTVEKSFSSMIPYLGNGMESLATVKIPSGYTTIESGDGGRSGAFQNQTGLYRVEIPASVTKIGKNVFDGCDMSRLTIVAPYGSAAEAYAISHGIHYANDTALSIVTGGAKMYAGEERTIAVYNNGAKVTWKSTKPAVATVNAEGKVTAKKAGKTTITAKIGKKTYRYAFTVLSRTESNVLSVIWENYVTADMSDYEKALAASRWMADNVSPAGSSDLASEALAGKSASRTGYALAYQKILAHYGLTVKVVPDGAFMTNKVKIGGKTYKVSALPAAKNIDKTYTTTGVSGIRLKRNCLTLTVGKKGTFGGTGAKKTLRWSSSDKRVATVDKNGTVKATGAGCAKITMTVDGKSYVCTVRVNPVDKG